VVFTHLCRRKDKRVGQAEQETAGTWFWNGTTLRVNATFRNASIPHQNNIDWNSVATFTTGNNAFSILGRAAVNAPLTRFTLRGSRNGVSH